MIWAIISLYGLVVGRMRCPSEEITNTIGMLFGLYIDEISTFIEQARGGGASPPVHSLLFYCLLMILCSFQIPKPVFNAIWMQCKIFALNKDSQ